MILQALVRHYEDLAASGEISRPGWLPAKVSYALRLSPDGQLKQVVSLKSEQQMGKKTVLAPRIMPVPEQVKRTVGVASNFLCDNATYFLGLDSKGKPERARNCFEAAKDLHLSLLQSVSCPAAQAICGFFSTWDPDTAETHPLLADVLDDLKSGANLVFQTGMGDFAQDDPALRDAWQRYYDQDEGETAICLITGERTVPVTLHPALKNIPGAQSTGASLVSFNAPCLESYDHEQGANAPTGKYAAFAYGAALNHLLADREHRQVIGDTTIVFWAEGGQPAYQDLTAFALNSTNPISDREIKAIFHSLAKGQAADIQGHHLDPNTHFYVLALSPNAGRVSVRFFWQDTFGALAQNIDRFYQELEIVRPSYYADKQQTLWSLLQETVNQHANQKVPDPNLTGEMLRAVLTGGRYPATLRNAVHLRIRADHQVTWGRAALLKAYYTRNDPNYPKEVLRVELDPKTPVQNIPYTLGRMFSILENIQQAANPGINTTIKDKYFNSASATPALIFPVLINLAQKHLRKLDRAHAVYFDKQLTELAAALGDTYPSRLTLPEQGAFQLGYYHQTQLRYAGKKEEN